MANKNTGIKSIHFERFDKTLKLKIQNDEKYTMEDRNDFYLTLYGLVQDGKINETNILNQ